LDEEKVIPPKQLVRRDGDDPYLVVAADKGTATFSDTANALAQGRGFWMGDAFASGGSVGYDHKGMGITAKGAWEGVKRHFREMGRNIQKEPFTVVGIGDMSGDVFGNGMLLSKQIRLQAAFNHLHIFLDPDPDPAVSFKERKRLFALPRSGWTDYNPELISRGGGVFSRHEKSIPLSKPVRDWLGIEDQQLTPDELISRLLRADVDLLWNGGIGTYVKSSRESQADVGDLANNGLRVNGNELRCKVVGEGGNLGLTQLGRIEYARCGGRLNTDFIDNSAGVDCSDHEVNIKLLLDQAIRAGKLTLPARNELLADMTGEVEALVLRSNYLQTQALSMMERLSGARLGAKQRFMNVLEDEGLLDRALEFLPEDDELMERRNRGEGLYRPELAVLLSYSKIRLYQNLLDSDVPEDPFLCSELTRYFPAPLQERYADLILDHRLRREIVATQVTNSLVNRMGISFVVRMREDTGAVSAKLARAYTVARELLDARDFWARVEALDNRVPAALQIDAMLVMWNQLRQVTRWIANLPGSELQIRAMIDRLKPGLLLVQKGLLAGLDSAERARLEHEEAQYTGGGFPQRLARRIAVLPMVFPMLDVVETAAAGHLDVMQVASVYRGLGESLGLRWLRTQVESLRVEGQWHAQARGNLRDELYAHHRELVDAAIRSCGIDGDPVQCWIGKNNDQVCRVVDMMDDMRNLERIDYSTASVAVRSLGQLLSSATG
jgi:glutamate dehydrogenase